MDQKTQWNIWIRFDHELKGRSIATFQELVRAFIVQFLEGRDHIKPPTYLLTIQQGRNETLREYVARFNSEALQIEGYIDGLRAIVAGLGNEKF